MPLPQSLSQALVLEGVTSRQVLLHACRHLASLLAEQMAAGGLVWQEVSVYLQTESGAVSGGACLLQPRKPFSLYPRLELVVAQVSIPSPVDGIRVTVGGLAPAPVEQMILFDVHSREREAKLQQVMEEINRLHPLALVRASTMESGRREKMLTFYDPFRQGEKSFAPAAAGAM